VIFDRGDDFTGMLVEMVRRGIVPLIGGGLSKLQPVARADVAMCMAASLEMPQARGRVFELGGADRIAFKDLLEMIAAHEGEKPKMIRMPASLMKPIVRVMERFPWFPLTSDQLTMLLEDNVCDTSEAERTFGFKPASFIQALPELLA
jgi:NADH dehydrogenase